MDIRFSIVSVGQKHRADRRASLLVHTLLRQAPCPCTAHVLTPFDPGGEAPGAAQAGRDPGEPVDCETQTGWCWWSGGVSAGRGAREITG